MTHVSSAGSGANDPTPGRSAHERHADSVSRVLGPGRSEVTRRGFLTGSAATLGLFVVACRDDLLTPPRTIARPRMDVSPGTAYAENFSTATSQTNLDQWPTAAAPDWAYTYIGSGVRGIRVEPTPMAPSARAVYGYIGSTEQEALDIARLIRPNMPTGDQRFSATVWSGAPSAGAIAYTSIGVRWATSGSVDGYSALYRGWDGKLVLKRWDGGTQVDLASVATGLGAGVHTLVVEAVGTGSSVTLRVLLDGTLQITYTDTSPNRKLSGVPALLGYQTQYAGEHTPYWGDLVYQSVSAPPASVTAARYTLPYAYDVLGNVTGSLGVDASTGAITGAVFDASYPAALPTTATVVGSTSSTPEQNATALRNAVVALGSNAGRVRLAAGASFAPITFPARPRSAGVISIEHQAVQDGTFAYAAGVAVPRTADTTTWPKFEGRVDAGNPGVDSFVFANGASRYRFVGIEWRYDPRYLSQVGAIGSGGATTYGFLQYVGETSNATAYPFHVVIDRCVAHGEAGLECQRAFRVHGKLVAVLETSVFHIGHSGNDGQSFLATSGSGPYYFRGCVFSGRERGECVMFGGGNVGAATEVPGDIQIVGCTFEDASQASGEGFENKNLLEFKVANRAAVDACTFGPFRSNWPYSQLYAVVVKLASQYGTDAGFIVCENVTIRRCRFIGVSSPLVINGTDGGADKANAVNRVEFVNNFVGPFHGNTPVTPSRQLGAPALSHIQINGGSNAAAGTTQQARLRQVSIRSNTLYGPASGDGYPMYFGCETITSVPIDGWEIADNVIVLPPGFACPQTYLGGSGFAASKANAVFAAATVINGTIWTNNAIVNSTRTDALITGDVAYASASAAGIDPLTGAMTSTSPLLTGGRNGVRQGCAPAVLTG